MTSMESGFIQLVVPSNAYVCAYAESIDQAPSTGRFVADPMTGSLHTARGVVSVICPTLRGLPRKH